MFKFDALRLFLGVPLLFCLTLSQAGVPDGPFLVFVDVGRSPGLAAKAVKSYMDSERGGDFCGRIARSPLIFMRKRPEGLDDRLLRSAMIAKDAGAIRRVQKILIDFRYEDDVRQGLDGVVAFADDGAPKMLGLGIKGGVSAVRMKSGSVSDEVVSAFCSAIPRTYRN